MEPAALAQLCADIYTTTTDFDIYDCDGVYAGLREVAGQILVVFRGSANTQDWLDDFYAIPVKDPKLGTVHGGMFRGIPEYYQWLRKTVAAAPQPQDIILTGHSLGGAHARLIAGLLAADCLPATQLVTFGSPKPGCKQLASLVDLCGTHKSYRHCQDIVPTLPPDIFGYIHTEPWVELGTDPASGLFEPAADHSINLYLQALQP